VIAKKHKRKAAKRISPSTATDEGPRLLPSVNKPLDSSLGRRPNITSNSLRNCFELGWSAIRIHH